MQEDDVQNLEAMSSKPTEVISYRKSLLCEYFPHEMRKIKPCQDIFDKQASWLVRGKEDALYGVGGGSKDSPIPFKSLTCLHV